MNKCLILSSTSFYYTSFSTTKFQRTVWNLKHPKLLAKPNSVTIFKNHVKAKASSVGDVSDEFSNFLYSKKTVKSKENKERSHLQEFVTQEHSDAARIEFLEFGSNATGHGEELTNFVGQQNPNAERSEILIRKKESGRQTLKRSSILAKQVICVESALSLGFVSQLWVDVDSFRVLVIEVRPNLLSGEIERILLEDVMQVGDVLLVEDESVVEKEINLVGLETLVGYSVVTPAGQKIGKNPLFVGTWVLI
ncbi:hypothetical protein Leryth_024094 [Lithospermum erythrorhizon]|nr:hypothetical protein Leryth_024094 [Lithospermum erythrorhizon]